MALSGIGDALMFTPALKILRQELPNSEIDVLVMFGGAKDIFKNNPNVNNLIHFNFINEGTIRSLRFVLSLRKKYDVIINVYPSNRKEYNLISFLIGAKKRVAVDYLRMNKQNFGWLNNITIKENDSLHNVQTNIRMIEKLIDKKIPEEPKLELFLTEEDLNYAESFFQEKKISENDFIIGIHPGCATLKNHIKRRWEPEKFSQLANLLIKNYSAKILIFGGPEESELKRQVKNNIHSDYTIIIETDTLNQSSAIMKRCDLFITNDSALMHIASALSLPIVAIIGPTNVSYIHPWKTKYKIASLNLECSPCFFYSPKPLTCKRDDVKFKCIKELTVENVLTVVSSMIEELNLFK
ncbi:ADP-heptose:LPS heptosyltransferase [Ignavibacterium album JCM 16511]|uniref:ADP-heptose:LPS heptosyltransferase n=2 Tax=Ignavibacterium album TaxID=591197 RepID=I0AN09_IGNAJ|nr:ADP-heptose:LPS heptosyltransferase [Ignavibacterium album JCM 16511]